MKNIAVLYDIENLVGGYNLKYLSEISLKNILVELDNMSLSNIALQKAYADWSNHKLNQLKWDITELGIEPIQMFGFSKGNMKNAADIQLVIDTMEILYTKDFIDTFVIVSGDGGFSSLVKKISEHGKKVIGCAYKNTANQVFIKVCDDFIYIDNTLSKEQLNMLNQISIDENKKKQIIENPILKNVLPELKSYEKYDIEVLKSDISLLMEKLWSYTQSKKVLKYDGLNISIFKSALNYMFIEFEFRKFGFVRLSDFICYVLKDTEFYLALKAPSDYRIVHNNYVLKNFEKIDCSDKLPKTHSQENYLRFLSSMKSLILTPDIIEYFYEIVDFMLKNKASLINVSYSELIQQLGVFSLDEKVIHKTISFMYTCGILKGDIPLAPLIEQHFYFSSSSKDEVFQNISITIRNKLIDVFGSVDEKELEKLLIKFQY